jgi:hypothetical protein
MSLKRSPISGKNVHYIKANLIPPSTLDIESWELLNKNKQPVYPCPKPQPQSLITEATEEFKPKCEDDNIS